MTRSVVSESHTGINISLPLNNVKNAVPFRDASSQLGQHCTIQRC